MIEFAEARQRILSAVPTARPETVPLREALGRYVAEPVHAHIPVPGFDNSAMDGYAVRVADAQAGAVLPILGEQPAGRDLGLKLQPGAAIRIFTGAPLPEGAEAVVMQEDTEPGDGGVRVLEAPTEGEFVRRRGADLCEGQRILEAGDRLTPRRIALLAAQGLSEVSVGRRARVRILTSGDELIPPGGTLAAGELFNSNGAMLAAQLGHAEVSHRHVIDELAAVQAAITDGLEAADVLIIVGGVSVGERDFVKAALINAGVKTEFWRVRMKPGKPFLYGEIGEKRVFGLPGNPVSAYVTFHTLARPASLRWEGAAKLANHVRTIAAGRIDNPGDRPHFVRGSYDGRGFSPIGLQQSHALFGLSQSNALLLVDAGDSIATGDALEVELLDALL